MTSLLQAEQAADTEYNLPTGTMEYIGQKESSQGTNTGSIGNIFQVLPSTASKPGYGLTSVDGNSASSTAAYVAALEKRYGSISAALNAYSAGAYDGSDMSSVLNNLNMIGSNVDASVQPASSGSGPLSWLAGATNIEGWLQNKETDLAFIVVAVLLIAAGLFSLVLSSNAGRSAAKIVEVAA